MSAVILFQNHAALPNRLSSVDIALANLISLSMSRPSKSNMTWVTGL